MFIVDIYGLAMKPCASHTKVYFNEFVANAFCDNIGIVDFNLRGYGGCYINESFVPYI
jgi:hypothetical protein